MTLYTLLLGVHIVLAGIWLGTDIGTMASFRRLRDPRLALPTRLAMSRLSDLLDMGPRSALVLLLMLGLVLTHLGGWGLTGPGGGALAWAAGVLGPVWLAGLWHQFWVTRGERAAVHVRIQRAFRPADLVLRVTISGALGIAAVLSLVATGPLAAPWLSAKLILFSGIVLCGVGLRLLIPHLVERVAAIVAAGSSPQREAALSRTAVITEALVWLIWAQIALITWLAVVKPS